MIGSCFKFRPSLLPAGVREPRRTSRRPRYAYHSGHRGAPSAPPGCARPRRSARRTPSAPRVSPADPHLRTRGAAPVRRHDAFSDVFRTPEIGARRRHPSVRARARARAAARAAPAARSPACVHRAGRIRTISADARPKCIKPYDCPRRHPCATLRASPPPTHPTSIHSKPTCAAGCFHRRFTSWR